MTTPPGEGLLAPSDIAEIAGVSRAAVSNWRKRMSDFPLPASGTANKPLFSTSDVESWLVAHPEKVRTADPRHRESRSWEAGLWGVANLLRGGVSVEMMAEIFVQAAVDEVEGLASDQWPNVEPEAITQLRAVIREIPRENLADAVDEVLERTSRAQGKSSGETGFIGSRTSALLASLAAELEGGTLYDPACGIGVALVRAVEMGARPDRLVGDDVSGRAARIAHGRGKLRGIDIEVNEVDVLRDDVNSELRADVIIAEPPLGLRIDSDVPMLDARLRFGFPPRSSGDSFWLQHVVAHLAVGGTGYVVTTRGVLSREGAEAEIRRNLLRAGWISAVVALPGKMLPHTSAPLALWVLKDGAGSGGAHVLLIDATSIHDPETLVSRWLTNQQSLDGVPHRRVPIDELASGGADLSPPKWVQMDPKHGAELRDEFHRSRSQLAKASHELRAVGKSISAPRIAGEVQVLTVGDLVEIGAGEVVPSRPAREIADPGLLGRHVDAAAVREGALSDVASLPKVVHGAPLTEPGDILVTVAHAVRAVVDEEGGHVPVGSVYRLRVRDRSNIDPHYLAEVLTGQWNLRLSVGASIPRVPIRHIEVPMLPLSDQHAVVSVLGEARRAGELARSAEEASFRLVNTILDSARYGVNLTDPQGSTR